MLCVDVYSCDLPFLMTVTCLQPAAVGAGLSEEG